MVTLWCLQFSLKSPELCYWHHRLPIQGNAVKFISVLSTPNKSSKQGTIWQIRPWKCGFSMWGVKLLKSWMITACTFSPGISYSYFTCHFLVHPITSLSFPLLSLLCAFLFSSPPQAPFFFWLFFPSLSHGIFLLNLLLNVGIPQGLTRGPTFSFFRCSLGDHIYYWGFPSVSSEESSICFCCLNLS